MSSRSTTPREIAENVTPSQAEQIRHSDRRARRLKNYVEGLLPPHLETKVDVVVTSFVATAAVLPATADALLDADETDIPPKQARQLVEQVDGDYLILVTAQPASTDIIPGDDQITADKANQFGLVFHELLHILKTAISSVADLLSAEVDDEYEELVHDLINTIEDGAIESEAINGNNFSDNAAVRLGFTRRIHSRFPEDLDEEQREFTFWDAVNAALYQYAIYPTGVVDVLLDPDDSRATFKSEEDRAAFLSVNDELEQLAEEALAIRSSARDDVAHQHDKEASVKRAKRVLQTWHDVLKPLLDEDSQEEQSNQQQPPIGQPPEDGSERADTDQPNASPQPDASSQPDAPPQPDSEAEAPAQQERPDQSETPEADQSGESESAQAAGDEPAEANGDSDAETETQSGEMSAKPVSDPEKADGAVDPADLDIDPEDITTEREATDDPFQNVLNHPSLDEANDPDAEDIDLDESDTPGSSQESEGGGSESGDPSSSDTSSGESESGTSSESGDDGDAEQRSGTGGESGSDTEERSDTGDGGAGGDSGAAATADSLEGRTASDEGVSSPVDDASAGDSSSSPSSGSPGNDDASDHAEESESNAGGDGTGDQDRTDADTADGGDTGTSGEEAPQSKAQQLASHTTDSDSASDSDDAPGSGSDGQLTFDDFADGASGDAGDGDNAGDGASETSGTDGGDRHSEDDKSDGDGADQHGSGESDSAHSEQSETAGENSPGSGDGEPAEPQSDREGVSTDDDHEDSSADGNNEDPSPGAEASGEDDRGTSAEDDRDASAGEQVSGEDDREALGGDDRGASAEDDREGSAGEQVSGEDDRDASAEGEHGEEESPTASQRPDQAPAPAPAHADDGGGPELDLDALESDRDRERRGFEESTVDEGALAEELEALDSQLDDDDDGEAGDSGGSGDDSAAGSGAGPGSLDELSVLPQPTDPVLSAEWDDIERGAEVVGDTLAKELQLDQQTGTRSGLTSGSFDTSKGHRLSYGDPRCFQRDMPGEEKRYALVIVLDRSGSMRRGSPSKIETATAAVARFALAAEDLGIEVAIIDFYQNEARLVKPFSVEVEYAQETLLAEHAGGGTPLSDALALARDLVESQRNEPLIVTITDDRPRSVEAVETEIKATFAPVCSLTIATDCQRGNPPQKAKQLEQTYNQTETVFDERRLDDRLDQFASLLGSY